MGTLDDIRFGFEFETGTTAHGGAITQWVFCYGSNGLDQLRERVKHRGKWVSKPVVLENHSRVFAGDSYAWDGAVASIFPNNSKTAKVYGTIVKLNKAEIKQLDKYEGVASDYYYKWDVNVKLLEDNSIVKAMAYIKTDTTFTRPPSIEYLKAIEENLKNSGINDKQVGKSLPVYYVKNDKIKKYGIWKFGTDSITIRKKKEKNTLV